MSSFFKSVVSKIDQYKLPLISGVLQATSYIPFPPWALFFCLVPLWFFWLKSDFKRSVIGTLVCAFVASFIGFHWIAITVHDFGQMPWPLAILALSGFSLIANVYLVFAAITWRFLSIYIDKYLSLWLLPFIAAIFMCFFPSLFPFHFGYAWIYAKLPGAQIGDIFGMTSLAMLTLLINFLVFMAVRQKKYLAYGLSAIVLFITINTLGVIRSQFLPEETKSINTLIVQANYGNLEKQMSLHQSRFREVIIEKYIKLSTTAIQKWKLKNPNQDLDLVVWPETAYPAYLDLKNFNYTANPLNAFTKDYNTSLATGFYHAESGNRVANAILYVNSLGELADTPTHKTILLAFGEYLPFSETFPILKKWLPMVADFIRGKGPESRIITGVSVGPMVCYESLFPWFSRELANQQTNLFINLTNDSWYDDVFEPNQHMYITAGRAIENRRPVIRATNTGISTVIRSDGSVMSVSPRDQEWTGIYKVSYPERNYQTPYQKWGKNSFIFILFASTLLLVIIGRIKFN